MDIALTKRKSARTLTREDLRNAVRERIPTLSPEEAKKLVDQTFEEIVSGLDTDEKVMLSGFGAFKIRNKKERTGRNPMTGIEATITPRRSVLFKPSGLMRQRINSGWRISEELEDPET